MTNQEKKAIENKQFYCDMLATFLTLTARGDTIYEFKVDETQTVTATVGVHNPFEYSIWGDSEMGIFRDTIRALIREGYMEEL